MNMTSAIAFGLARGLNARDEKGAPKSPDLAEAIHRGLAALRDLIENGHGRVGDEPPPGFPVARADHREFQAAQRFAKADVPWQCQSNGRPPADSVACPNPSAA
jgi:hypothetical protein